MRLQVLTNPEPLSLALQHQPSSNDLRDRIPTSASAMTTTRTHAGGPLDCPRAFGISCAVPAKVARSVAGSHEARVVKKRTPASSSISSLHRAHTQITIAASRTSARPPRALASRTRSDSRAPLRLPRPGSLVPFPVFQTEGELLAMASNVGGPKPEPGSPGTPGSTSRWDPSDRPPLSAVRCCPAVQGGGTCRGVDAYVNPNLVSGGTSPVFEFSPRSCDHARPVSLVQHCQAARHDGLGLSIAPNDLH